MTYEEAVKTLTDIFKEAKEGVCYVTEVDCEALGLAIKSLEKQIPKKVFIQTMQIKDCIDKIQFFNKKICPNCGEAFCADWKYCFNCGQAIDWKGGADDE